MNDVTLIRRSRYFWRVTFRADGYGIYLLVWGEDDLGPLVERGWTVQWGEWITNNSHLSPGFHFY